MTKNIILLFLLFLNVFYSCKKATTPAGIMEYEDKNDKEEALHMERFYKFSDDIYKVFSRDKSEWKYQEAASEYSFGNYYQKALEVWDENGVEQIKTAKEELLNFKKFKPVDAKNYIIERAKNEKIIIINEAHHNPRHRVFSTSILQGLYNKGFRYLGLEAINDSLINKIGYATTKSGFYIKEPQFGNLVFDALKIGFTVFGYETENEVDGREREIDQANNISRILEKDPNAKIFIHCGFDHVIEGIPNVKGWKKAMAGRLKEITGIDPFTIDQVIATERGNRNMDNPYIKLANSDNSVIMKNQKGILFCGNQSDKKVDCWVIHPITKYINGQPNWKGMGGKKLPYIVPVDKKTKPPFLVLAYRRGEFQNGGIPSDIIEIKNVTHNSVLFLSPNFYEIIILNKDYKILKRYYIEITI
jgi:hypothetical protein